MFRNQDGSLRVARIVILVASICVVLTTILSIVLLNIGFGSNKRASEPQSLPPSVGSGASQTAQVDPFLDPFNGHAQDEVADPAAVQSAANQAGIPVPVVPQPDFPNRAQLFLRRFQNPQFLNIMNLTINRQTLFNDSYNQIMANPGHFLTCRTNIRYVEEAGIDAGGLTRDWYMNITREMVADRFGLFTQSANGFIYPKILPVDQITPFLLLRFEFVGMVIGRAVATGHYIEFSFTQGILKQILGQPVTLDDMYYFDPEKYRNIKTVRDYAGDVADLTLSMVASYSLNGTSTDHPLVPNGGDIDVTAANVRQYIDLYVGFFMREAFRQQITALIRGFYRAIPLASLAGFNSAELELLLCGASDIDVEDWRRNSRAQFYGQEIAWFWNIIRALPQEGPNTKTPVHTRNVVTRHDVLFFVTAMKRPPVGGFANLQPTPFTFSRLNGPRIEVQGSGGRSYPPLPITHTCFNRIEIPRCHSQAELRYVLLKAVREGSANFGIA